MFYKTGKVNRIERVGEFMNVDMNSEQRQKVDDVLRYMFDAFYGDKGSLVWLLVHPDKYVRDIGEKISREI